MKKEKASAHIIGLQSDNKRGMLKAFKMIFHPKTNRLVVFKGAAGTGKTTALDEIKTSIQGRASFDDKNLLELPNYHVPILDGDHKLFLGFKPMKDGKDFKSFLYEIDKNGKKIDDPTIEGLKCTPSAWQKLMTTELTWNYSSFTSKNPSEHKATLLKLFQSQLKQIGVVFDKKASTYKGSIRDKMDIAIQARSYAEMKRKEGGGVAEHLKEQHGVDTGAPQTWPVVIPMDKFSDEVAKINQSLGNLEADKKIKLGEIKQKATELEKSAMVFNDKVEVENKIITDAEEAYKVDLHNYRQHCDALEDALIALKLSDQYEDLIAKTTPPIDPYANNPEAKTRATYIVLDKGHIVNYNGEDPIAKKIIADRVIFMEKYKKINNEPLSDKEYQDRLVAIDKEKELAEANNKIVAAIDLFKDWQEKDGAVKKLQNEYIKLLAKIDVGVEGMKIVPEKDDVYLMYNGQHDPLYFHPTLKGKCEFRKLHEYSGTQLPMICLLLQAHMLDKKERSLRYMFIDDVPIDKKTQAHLNMMCEKLNMWVFVNINGDFEAADLKNGEMLFEGGEILLPNAVKCNLPEKSEDLNPVDDITEQPQVEDDIVDPDASDNDSDSDDDSDSDSDDDEFSVF